MQMLKISLEDGSFDVSEMAVSHPPQTAGELALLATSQSDGCHVILGNDFIYACNGVNKYPETHE